MSEEAPRKELEREEMDESLYEDELDHEGHWFEIWGED